jgi:hypothetical protein
VLKNDGSAFLFSWVYVSLTRMNPFSGFPREIVAFSIARSETANRDLDSYGANNLKITTLSYLVSSDILI